MTIIRCPNCGKSFDSQQSPALPFCCHRCRLIDLGQWLDEAHGLPYESDNGPEGPDEPG